MAVAFADVAPVQIAVPHPLARHAQDCVFYTSIAFTSSHGLNIGQTQGGFACDVNELCCGTRALVHQVPDQQLIFELLFGVVMRITAQPLESPVDAPMRRAILRTHTHPEVEEASQAWP